MSGLITVEDYNSALLNYTGLFWYEIDCNKLWESGLQSDEFYYDWIRVVKDGNTFYLYGVHGFPLWTGGVRTYGLSGSGGSTTPTPHLNLSVFEDEEDKGKCYLEMGINHFDSGEVTTHFFAMEGIILNNNLFVKTPKTFQFEVDWALRYYHFKLHLKKLDDTIIELTNPTIEEGSSRRRLTFEYDGSELIQNTIKLIYNVGEPLDRFCHFSINQFKSPNFLNITGDLILGKADNKIIIEPFYSGMKCKYSYLDKEETIILDDTQEVTIDLSDKANLKDLLLKVEIEEGIYSNKEILEYYLPVNYDTISSFSSFKNELENINGSNIIRLNANLASENNDTVYINHDVIVYGNDYDINLNCTSFILKEDINVTFYDTNFIEGDNAIIQKQNSQLELYDCSFKNCTSSHNEGLGSCVYCDIDLSSLTIPNDFTTIIQGTTFKDCHGAILHGGELTVSGCDYRLNNSVAMNTHSPYFLYQTDGNATITGSLFDVDLIEDIHFCEDLDNANLAQCLFVCGEDAIINGLSSKELESKVTFFEYNNRSHIFMKYYYPEISACVYISPEPHYEDKSLCYNISNVDYVFRENVQISRADSGNENTTNPLRELI